MKYTFFFFVFGFNLLLAQTIDIPLILTDGNDTLYHMRLGVDSTATNGIDPHLGESDLPPVPPSGLFEARFDLYPYTGQHWSTYRDYRYAPYFPFTGSHEHRLIWQLGFSGTQFKIIYDLPAGVTMQIKDEFGGIVINSGILCCSGNFAITFPLTSLRITMYYNNAGGNPAGPIFGLSSNLINFPQSPVGTIDTIPVTVMNQGNLNTLTIGNISSSNNSFSVSHTLLPINIAPLGSEIIYIINTSDTAIQSGTISFIHNAPGSPGTLNVQAPPGLSPGPFFNLSASSLIFPQHTPGTVDSLSITVSNPGFRDTLYISNISSTNNFFTFRPNILPIAVPPHLSQDFYIYYTSADTLQNGSIVFSHNASGSPAMLHVSSIFSDPVFYLYPAAMACPQPFIQHLARVENFGNFDPIIITDIVISNSNFSIVSPYTLPVVIPANSSWYFRVRVNDAPGHQTGTFKFLHNAPGSPHYMFLSNQLYEPMVKGCLVVKSGTMTGDLWFGIDTLGTDGLDGLLGEMDVPPPPPMTVFDRRFILPVNNFSGFWNSLRDFRHGTIAFNGQKEYRIYYQPSGNNGIEISWYLPESISGVLTDIINGTLINVPIADSGSYIVQDPILFNKLKMLIDFNLHTPVELISFEALAAGSGVKLHWSTASENNNKGFEIERRQDNNDWKNIGFVPGSGTVTAQRNYSFIDETAAQRETYSYRLKQIDLNGEFNYSNEVQVIINIPVEFTLEQNYPNPFNNSTLIKYSIPAEGIVTLKVYNVIGEIAASLVDESQKPGTYEISFNTGQLPSGVYLYRLESSSGNYSAVRKMILIK